MKLHVDKATDALYLRLGDSATVKGSKLEMLGRNVVGEA